ncbi:hypothetical protein CAEBREN_06824 [Caenorhabditis brenneri]|uniref:Uncharacterized protein n=1 Tax=Caenorhabditis brenneri TaxID=135651 RepID=G0NCF5_CAEBE|nr:hypothetical protein CAEBREN_06824 [Caenorhabditis brenneri]
MNTEQTGSKNTRKPTKHQENSLETKSGN